MTPLARLLRRRIAEHGPIPVAEYMGLALGHPRHGYYRHRDPLGRAGDFITAPEISQVFGEIIGLWCATVWGMMGAPAPVRLVELGPGRGTLMADLLRAAALVPPFAAAAEIHLVETSPALRRKQRRALAGRTVRWHDRLDSVPGGPMILVANEFFDALPIRQFVRHGGEWRERLVGVAGDGFAFALGPAAEMPFGEAEDGTVRELCPDAATIAAAIAGRLAAAGGAALAIDYGPARSGPGDSLQAVRGHAYAPVLADPGEADLSAHVDFQALAEAAAPARAFGPVPQGVWLRRLGAELRAEQLARANPERAAATVGAAARLIDPAEMGTLFKVLGLSHPAMPALPGFEPAEERRR